jgi:hypothetical protein
MAGLLGALAFQTPGRSRRASSFDRTGGNRDSVQVEPGATCKLLDVPGAGVVRHVWMTLSSADALSRRSLVLRAFWDGQAHPSVESPLGDFFGQGWGEKYDFASLPLAAAPKEGHALVSYWPMPFAAGARIEVENQSDQPVDALYFYVDYDELDALPPGALRFHAWYNQELTAPEAGREHEWGVLGETPENQGDAANYLLCEAVGEGHFAGVNYYVQSPGPMWYGEGDDMFLVDGEPWPGIHGTGTEDYFNMSWCPDTLYAHPYFGCARAPGRGNGDPRFGWLGRTHLYRFHIEDPVRFHRSLRASIEHGHANNLTLDLASVAYWYQGLPSQPFPALPGREARLPRPGVGVVEVHRWRDAWRQSRGGGVLWGDEP